MKSLINDNHLSPVTTKAFAFVSCFWAQVVLDFLSETEEVFFNDFLQC